MSEKVKFFYNKNDLSKDHHIKCYAKCGILNEDMINCCNVRKPCPVVSHVSCSNLDPEVINHLSFWYCNSCTSSDPVLKQTFEEEFRKANSTYKLLKFAETIQEDPVKLFEQKDAELEETAKELAKCLDELEEKEKLLQQANEKFSQLQNQFETQASQYFDSTQMMPTTSAHQDGPSTSSSRIREVLDRAHRRHQSDRRDSGISYGMQTPFARNRSNYFSSTRNAPCVTFASDHDNDHQRSYASTIAEAASAYPDYEGQETQADAFSAEQLRLIRSHVTDPAPFDGDVAKWSTFKTMFVGSSARGYFRAIEDMERLRRLIIGEALRMYGTEIADPFAHPTYVLKKLDNFYGIKGNALRHQLDRIWQLPKIDKPTNKEPLMNLFASVKQYALLCRQHNQEAELTAESSLILVESRMHVDHVTTWRDWATTNKYAVGIDAIIAFLEDRLRLIQQRSNIIKPKHEQQPVLTVAHVTGGQADNGNDNASSSKSKKGKKGGRSQKPVKCFGCSEEHPFYNCPKFKGLSATEKIETVKRLKVCENCLGAKRHKAANCAKQTIQCTVPGCQILKRHPMLHGHPDHQLKDVVFTGTHDMQASVPWKQAIQFKVVPGHVVAANGDLLPITILFDSGSGLSLSEMSLLSQAGWSSRTYELSMKWTSDVVRTEVDARLHNVQFIPQGRKNAITLSNITAVNDLNLPEQSQDPCELKKVFPYLKKINLPAFSKQRPQILLGLPHARFMASQHTIKDPQGVGPVAELSELGWTVSGNCDSGLGIQSMQDPRIVGFTCSHFSPGKEESVESLIELIKYMFSQDSLGIKAKVSTCLSADDRKAIEMINESLKYLPEERRYEIGLLWRDKDCILPNNYDMAFSRLKAAEYRLKKLGLEQMMIDQFNQEKANGQLVPVTREELNQLKRANFVPGFVTFNMNKIPPKPRWVNDTAATFKGVSLNSKLLKGPDNLVPLPQALCAFREGAYTIIADVKKMFNQIMLKKEDQYSQLCLWRDCNSSKEPQMYRQTRVIFGPTCSPAVANAVRIRHAENSAVKYPKASAVALNQMYMDDVLDSRDSFEDAQHVARDLIKMFDEISWELTQFQSNNPQVLDAIPADRVSQKMENLSIDESEQMITKVLGMFYDNRTDSFMFRLNDDKLLKKCLTDDYHPTRKEMISLVMRVYDPLGIISHFHVHGRLLLQEMCRHGIEWKGRVPDSIYGKWKRWLKCFEQISQLSIPRRYSPLPIGDSEVTLHLFVDASQDAYACALYLRFDYGHVVYVKLMAAKARVAPVRHLTIPKLELNSAVIGSRILVTAREWQQRLNIKEYTAWSDSTTVLRWLYASHIRHKQYVAPRIAEIQELTAVNAWRYVPTDLNVADLATKWSDIDFSDANDRWHLGPDFLYKPASEWPEMPSDFSRYITDEATSAEAILFLKPLEVINPWQAGIFPGVSAHIRSNWPLYTRVVSKALIFVRKLRIKIGKPAVIDSPIIEYEAENLIIRQIQRAAFKEDYKRLMKSGSVAATSKLKSLSPFFCKETNLIRVKTRLSDQFPLDARYPPILPNVHETSDAIVNYFHRKHNHVGDNAIIGSVRSRVWIISARRAVRRAKARCVVCIKKRAKPVVPEMADLPEFRLDATKKPFFYTGVDCFGPFEVYCGHSHRKKSIWMIIFTCLITRAVFLEVLDEMSTDNVIAVIEKLWARRGPVGHFYSDNGRNFVGAENLLENESFQHKLVEKRVKWHRQPPYAPNFGGAWERLIKDVKRALINSVGKFPIPRIALESAVAQIESNMNDRPLTDIAVSPDDLEPLTPNLLMTGFNNHPFMSNHDITVEDLVSKKYVRCAKAVLQAYMKRWTQEALPEIARHKTRNKPAHYLKVDDVVIYIDPTKVPSEWKRGIITRVYKGKDYKVRVADVKIGPDQILERRAVSRLAKLDFRLENPEAEQEKYIDAKSAPKLPSHSASLLVTRPATKTNVEYFYENFSFYLSVKSQKINSNSFKKHSAKMAEGFTAVEHQIGILTEEEREIYLDPAQNRSVHVSNLPPAAGILEVWQALRAFGQISTILIPFWRPDQAFYAFIIFKRPQAAENAVANSRSFAIGFKGAYFRIAVEWPVKKVKPLENRGNRNLERIFVSFESRDFESRVLIVRMRQPDMNFLKVPLTCSEQVIRRQINEEMMYDFIMYIPDKNCSKLSKVILPKKLKPGHAALNDEEYDITIIANAPNKNQHAPAIEEPAPIDEAVITTAEAEEPDPDVIDLDTPVLEDLDATGDTLADQASPLSRASVTVTRRKVIFKD